ncbi:hypothetical protein [Flavobacterium piscis]|uniref:UDP-galactopyranose mutase n=1 Tax=Flavobacterium piscis TaxID=1114874 RepID=A0ABU1Y3D1_9FLAO|nr:hypothetical protein [Flavobacterium piscis]MDR7208734.1 UDP-galactopyranose mutase [Flavobacterium piscis]
MAERYALLGKRVLIIEKRHYIAGNGSLFYRNHKIQTPRKPKIKTTGVKDFIVDEREPYDLQSKFVVSGNYFVDNRTGSS